MGKSITSPTWFDEIDHFKKVFNTLSQQRHARRYYDPETGRTAWNHYEILEMWVEVCRRRGTRGWSEVPLSKVELVEALASGHADYYAKFALGCAELAWTEEW